MQSGRRKQRYAKIQRLMHKDFKSACSAVLNDSDTINIKLPSKATMLQYWTNIFKGNGYLEDQRIRTSPINPDMECLWCPINAQEIICARVSKKSASRPDGITPNVWTRIDIRIKVLLYNLFIFDEDIPSELKLSRTIFLSKKIEGSDEPGDFRPVSINSIVTREFNRLMANRISLKYKFDNRQAAYFKIDGVAQNIAVLSTILNEAKTKLKELHIVGLDMAKAFNSLKYESINDAVDEIGCPQGFKNYIKNLYKNVYTKI